MAEGEKRRQRRFGATGSVTIVTASGRTVDAEAIDVSLLGCRFSAVASLAVGDPVSTTLRFPSGRIHSVHGTIRSVSQGPPCQHGVAFTEETVERLIKDSFRQF